MRRRKEKTKEAGLIMLRFVGPTVIGLRMVGRVF